MARINRRYRYGRERSLTRDYSPRQGRSSRVNIRFSRRFAIVNARRRRRVGPTGARPERRRRRNERAARNGGVTVRKNGITAAGMPRSVIAARTSPRALRRRVGASLARVGRRRTRRAASFPRGPRSGPRRTGSGRRPPRPRPRRRPREAALAAGFGSLHHDRSYGFERIIASGGRTSRVVRTARSVRSRRRAPEGGVTTAANRR